VKKPNLEGKTKMFYLLGAEIYNCLAHQIELHANELLGVYTVVWASCFEERQSECMDTQDSQNRNDKWDYKE